MREIASFSFLTSLLLVAPGCTPTPGEVVGDTVDDTEGGSCEMYASSDDPGPSVELTIRNERTSTVFFGAAPLCGGFPLYTVTPAGESAALNIFESQCEMSRCESRIDADICENICPDCGPPSLGRLEPGAETTTTWQGTSIRTFELPGTCAPGEGCQRECERVDRAPDGTYTLGLVAYDTCEGNCECDGPGLPLCWLNGPNSVSGEQPFTVEVSYPSQTEVELVITE